MSEYLFFSITLKAPIGVGWPALHAAHHLVSEIA